MKYKIKKGQEEMVGFRSHAKRIRRKMSNKSGQEEMVGFALIVIIIAVVLIILLSVGLKKDETESVQSFEIESFIQTVLQYTTECEDNFEYKSVQDLIFSCVENRECLDGKNSCDVLNNTLKEILEESFKVGENRPEKGYFFNMTLNGEELFHYSQGNRSTSLKGAREGFTRRSNNIEIFFTVYS